MAFRRERSCYHDRDDTSSRGGILDSDYRIDVSEVNRNIDAVDVIAMYFPLLRKTLLLDLRTNEVDGPMIRVVPMANTPEERFQSLMKMRPRFGKPDTITIIPWPKYVQSLAEAGIWDHIVRRFADTGSAETVRQCERCYGELVKLEREEINRAIRGENYETIWGKPGVAEVTSTLLDEESDEDFDDEDDIIEDFYDED